ncbi:MAG: hypothetical protein IJW63_06400 [Lachnospiraceae bacterium]|nr:hypothetical protein [Lachnospiraceae bacterium]
MSSNVLKRHYTMVLEDDTRIIDTNELIAQKLEATLGSIAASNGEIDEEGAEGFAAGLNAQQLEVLFSETEGEMPVDGMPGGEVPDAPMASVPVYEGPDPQQLLMEAQEEIARMKEEAAKEIEEQRRAVFEQAKAQGLEEGKQLAMAGVAAKEKEFEDAKRQLEREYGKILDDLEPKFIDTLTSIYEHIFHVDLYKHRDIIVHLINTALRKAEGTGDILIHVSKEDYPYVTMQKKVLLAGVATSGSNIEIIEDVVLGRNQCMIETSSGIFDCSLDTELEELRGKLSLLSYVKAEEK